MNTAFIEEIESYLQHDDCSLAVRRTLDMTLDIGDAALMRKAIDWSKMHRDEAAKGTGVKMSASFFEVAKNILTSAASLQTEKKYTATSLLVANSITKVFLV
jgi:ABC-2 type transport system ATP-binding protein